MLKSGALEHRSVRHRIPILSWVNGFSLWLSVLSCPVHQNLAKAEQPSTRRCSVISHFRPSGALGVGAVSEDNSEVGKLFVQIYPF